MSGILRDIGQIMWYLSSVSDTYTQSKSFQVHTGNEKSLFYRGTRYKLRGLETKFLESEHFFHIHDLRAGGF